MRAALVAAAVIGGAGAAQADRIKNPTAVFSGLDKITGRIVSFELAVDETVQFGALQMTARVCFTKPPTENPNTTSFVEVEEAGADGKNRRVALSAMEENEPVLAAKVTGPGGRASLAAVLGEGMKAATVRVNDVLGVGGFIFPGERVDVIVTRVLDKGEAFSDVIAQNVRVLAVDQTADERSDKPAVVKAVTLEVTTAQAQKVTLATADKKLQEIGT